MIPDIPLNPTWAAKLQAEFEQGYFQQLRQFLESEWQAETIYPPKAQIFEALNRCLFEAVKVVIIGQDPYHGAGQANGLSFSVSEGQRVPPSLRNIFKEIEADVGTPPPKSGNLERWAEQGVLLLNAVLTVRAKTPTSHRKKGWEQFTDAIIRLISTERAGVVFMLWGNYAQQKGAMIDRGKHHVLESAHPSPYSAAKFFGQRHFSQANAYLESQGKSPIVW